jgi:hypothetical protein
MDNQEGRRFSAFDFMFLPAKESLEMDEIKLLDVVALIEDLESEGLRRGEVGTVVERWDTGVFEVEFSDDEGKAYAFAALRPDQIMKLYFRKDAAA